MGQFPRSVWHCVTSTEKSFFVTALPWYLAKSWPGNMGQPAASTAACPQLQHLLHLAPLWDAVLCPVLLWELGCLGQREHHVLGGGRGRRAAVGTKVWVNAVERQSCAYVWVLAVSPQSLGLCLQSCCSCGSEIGLAVVALGHRGIRTTLLLSLAVISWRGIATWPRLGKERQSSFSESMNMTSPCGRPLEVRIRWFSWFHANLIENNLIIQLTI